MSDNIPTVELLVKELTKVTKWYVFGVALGVPVSELDCIESENSDVENKKIQMFKFWLQYEVDASWKMVIQALEQNNQLVLVAELSKKYLLSDSSNTSEEEQGSTSTAVNESTAEIRATAAVVERLRDLETSFTNMLTDLLRLLTACKCDLSEAQFFLDDQFDTAKFSQCTNFNALLRQLRRGHVDTFNTYYLQQLVAYFKKDQLTERIKEYEAEKEDFLKDTTVIEFQRAVVSRVEPVNPSQMKDLTIKISKKLAGYRTLKDMEELALRAFGENQLEFVRIHVKLGSVIISVFFPETLTGKLEQLAHKNAAIFKDAGVEEVSVGGRVVFPRLTLEEELKDIPTASLKEIYTYFYHRLVEAVSDEHTCQSLLTSSALLSEKIAQLTSTMVTGSSFLKTLGLEEEPHLLVPLVSAMSGVEQLQTLAGEISATMRSNQAKVITQVTERQSNLDHKERQQLVADIERLTSDKADLLNRLHCFEEDLKTANELLILREKAISGMMMYRSGERESMLTRQIEDLKSKIMTKTDELNEAIKRNSELQDTAYLLKEEQQKINDKEEKLQEGEQAVRETKEENQQLQQLLNLSQEAIRAANRRADTAQQKIREKEEEETVRTLEKQQCELEEEKAGHALKEQQQIIQEKEEELQMTVIALQEQQQRTREKELERLEVVQAYEQQQQRTREKEKELQEMACAYEEQQQKTREKEEELQELVHAHEEQQQKTMEKEEELRETGRAYEQQQQRIREKEDELQIMTREKAEVNHLLEQQIAQQQAERLAQNNDWVVKREEVEMTEEKLNKGGWGMVNVAKFRGLRVAAKCLHEMIISDYNRRQFSREMTIAAKLRHPNLLLFIGATIEGEAVILTELMPTSLRMELRTRKLTEKEVVTISRDVSCGLNYMHRSRPHPIIHRDISSGNVLLELLSDGWRAKISDYGSANFINLIQSTIGPGSPAYAAPEAWVPDSQSPKMDVFSLGVLMVEMNVREIPEHSTAGRADQIQRIHWPAMVTLITNCISKQPSDRPDAIDIMSALDRMLQELS